MKILYTLPKGLLGGTENHLLKLSKEMFKEHDIYIFFLSSAVEDQNYEKALIQNGVYVHTGTLDPLTRSSDIGIKVFWQTITTLFKLISLCWQIKPDIIHGYLPISNTYASIVGRLMRVPVIVSQRGLLNYSRDSRLMRLMDRVAFNLADHIIVNCVAIKREITEKYDIKRGKVSLIYNGV